MKVKLLKKLRKRIYIQTIYTPIGWHNHNRQFNFIVINEYFNDRLFISIRDKNDPVVEQTKKMYSFATRKEAVHIRRQAILIEAYRNYGEQFKTSRKNR